MTIFILSMTVALFCAWLLMDQGFIITGIVVAGLIGLTSGALAARDERRQEDDGIHRQQE